MGTLFAERVFPVLTPLAVDPAHPFPYISGLSLNLAVVVRNPETGQEHFARVKVPPSFPRWLAVDDQRFVLLEDVIAAHLDMLFPGMEVVASHAFRVTRNEDLEVEEDDAENLLKALEKELLRRRFGPPVRLEVHDHIDPHVLDLLVSELDVNDGRGVPAAWPARPPRPVRHRRARPRRAQGRVVRAGDAPRPGRGRDRQPRRHVRRAVAPGRAGAPPVRLVRHQRAALRRAGGRRPARAGHQADPVPHLRRLAAHRRPRRRGRGRQAGAGAGRDQGPVRRAGQHPVGAQAGAGRLPRRVRPDGPEDACQACLVVRDEPDGIRRYSHIGTGNYNPKTARQYEDLGLLTADDEIGDDLTNLFNNLSGYSRGTDYQRLLLAPDRRAHRSDRSGSSTRSPTTGPAGRRGCASRRTRWSTRRSSTRCTGPAGPASRSRSAPAASAPCGPGVEGMSENIIVRSILGRFLEHSRIFWFENGGEPEVWIGSADLMHRNLDRRVEALVRVGDPRHVTSWAACWTCPSTTARRRGTCSPTAAGQRHHLDDERRAAARPAGAPDRRRRRRRDANARRAG